MSNIMDNLCISIVHYDELYLAIQYESIMTAIEKKRGESVRIVKHTSMLFLNRCWLDASGDMQGYEPMHAR